MVTLVSLLQPVTVETPQGTIYEGKRFHRQRVSRWCRLGCSVPILGLCCASPHGILCLLAPHSPHSCPTLPHRSCSAQDQGWKSLQSLIPLWAPGPAPCSGSGWCRHLQRSLGAQDHGENGLGLPPQDCGSAIALAGGLYWFAGGGWGCPGEGSTHQQGVVGSLGLAQAEG